MKKLAIALVGFLSLILAIQFTFAQKQQTIHHLLHKKTIVYSKIQPSSVKMNVLANLYRIC